ncbi:MAG TPA: tRNA (adenosine(37)-N6)-threonylcarbamoyltransferase complex ATPase subunit type 1 TsaE [Anaerolineaceae bacterium]|jgi:tRNA threonylcarbamoyladenosine biosynthesis protein TsaE|nr:tRNA (adenosine(37)-N6)-threonylcarbamoyltransferase complex ATPase subunit type 1 TsaE [Anaerolineaceae bacterium]
MPILKPHAFEFFSHSAEQTQRVGVRLGNFLQTGDVVCLEGDLGSGKTTLVRGIVQGWGSADRVTSPTYVIMNEYRHPTGMTFYHSDAYRLTPDQPLDSAILEIDQALTNGVLVMEWAERMKTSLPQENLWIEMNWINPEQRHLIFTPNGKRYEQLLKKLQKALFGA